MAQANSLPPKSFVLKILTSNLFDIKILQTLFADPAPSKAFRGYGGRGVPRFSARKQTIGRSRQQRSKLYFRNEIHSHYGRVILSGITN